MAHYQLCGSKTEKCGKCEDYVKLMDKKEHLAKNMCEKVIARKQKEEQLEQEKKLAEFQKQREEEIKRKEEQRKK